MQHNAVTAQNLGAVFEKLGDVFELIEGLGLLRMAE